MSNDKTFLSSEAAKIGALICSAWTAVALAPWSEIAAFLAAIYTGCLLTHWWLAHFWRPLFERIGWVERQHRRKTDDPEPPL